MSGACLVVASAAEHDLVANATVANDEDAIGVGGGSGVVRDEHDRLAQPIGGVPEQVEDLGSGRVVEVAGGLIGQEDRRLRRQRARQRDALLLAGRKAGRAGDRPCRSGRPWPAARRSASRCRAAVSPAIRKGRATFSATLSSGMRLKNWKTKPVLSRRRQRAPLIVEGRDADAVDDDLARRRKVEAAQQVEHRRLAGARAAHDGDELAALDREGDAPQRLDLALAQRVALDEVVGLEDHGHAAQSTDAGERRGIGRVD